MSATICRKTALLTCRLSDRERLALGLALGDLAVEVGTALRVALADLDDGDHVDRVVEVSVAAKREPVHDAATRRALDRRGAVVGGELVASREPRDVSGVAEDPAGEDRTDAVEVGEGGP